MGLLSISKRFLGRLKLWQGILLAILVPIGLLYSWVWWQSSSVSRQIDAELARIRAAGEPVTPADLERYYHVPDSEEDCTQLWLEALHYVKSSKFDSGDEDLPIVGWSDKVREIPSPDKPWQDLEAVEQFLRKNEKSLRLLHEAAAKGGPARYPTDFSLGPNMTLPYAQTTRQGYRFLSLQAHVLAHRNKPNEVVKSIHAIFMLAHSLEWEPIIISQLVRISIDAMAREQIRFLLPHVDFSEQELIMLQNDLRSARYHEGMHRAMIGERVSGIQYFENPDIVLNSISTNRAQEFLWRINRHDDFLLYLNSLRRLIKASRHSSHQSRREVERIEDEAVAISKDTSFLAQFRLNITSMVMPATTNCFDAAARSRFGIDAADTAIAMKRYHLRHGSLPTRLEELVPEFLPEVPIDPFDGKPIRYILRENEILLYSVGPDGIDDGGQDISSGATEEKDIVFSVESFE